MKLLAFVTKVISIISFCMCIAFTVMGQSKIATESLTLLQILPAVTFVFALFTGGVSLYTVSQMRKSKEEILSIVRAEFKNEIHQLENRMAVKEYEGREINKERIMNLKEALEGRLTSILDKVNALGK